MAELSDDIVDVTIIKPSRGWSAINLRELFRYRELLYFLTWRDIKVRYKQTMLGAAWAILQPLFPRWPRREVPVGHVTNGVHVPTWDSAAADARWTEACGKARWRGALDSVDADLRHVGDEALWRLETLALSGGDRLVPESVHRQVLGAVDVVVLVTRRSGVRSVASVAAVSERGVEEVYRC